MSLLFECLVRELERPRAVSEQVTKHLTETYEARREDLGNFLVNELPRLEDYEIDLALAPLFTPTLAEQAVVADLLGAESVPAATWPAVIQKLVQRPTMASLVTADGQTHRVPLREVTVERLVHRLRLDGTIAAEVAPLVARVAAQDQAIIKAVARRAIWDSAGRRAILIRFLETGLATATGSADAGALLRLVETYQPANLNELAAQIPHWQNVLREEINTGAATRPFFNERVEELHGGGRDRRRPDESRLAGKQDEMAFLHRLQAVLTG